MNRTNRLLADAASAFRDRGFSDHAARRAATELWLSCRWGTPLSLWFKERLDSAGTARDVCGCPPFKAEDEPATEGTETSTGGR